MHRRVVHIGLIVLSAWLVYLNTFQNGFHLDDFYRVVDNPGIQKLHPVGRHFVDPRTMSTLDRLTRYSPLLPLTLSLNYAVAGDSLAGYHWGNLLLQMGASVLLYLLCLELLQHWSSWHLAEKKQKLLALVVSLAFAIHPVSGILVNYISARDLILMQLFLLASFLAYLRMLRMGVSALRWLVVLVLLALSLLSKPNAVVAPVLVLVFGLTAGKENLRSAGLWLRALPFALVVLIFSQFYLAFSDVTHIVNEESTSILDYPLTQVKLHLFHYFRNFFWPFMMRQAPVVEIAHSFLDAKVLSGLAFIAGSLWAAWRLRISYPLISFCIGAYWTLMIPTSSVLPFFHFAVDYRSYPSSAFLFLAAGLAGFRFLKPRVLVPLSFLFIGYLAFASISLNKTWLTEETLWTHSLKYGGDALAHLNLAMAIKDRSDPRVREHLEEVLRLNPNYIVAHTNLGLLLIAQGEIEEGLDHCLKAVALNPQWAQSHYWLSEAYTRLGRNEDAAQASARAAQLDRHNLKYQYKAALDAQRLNDYAPSLDYIRVIEQVLPEYEETLFLKGFALQMTGDLEGATETYKTFLSVHPDHSQVWFNLGHALMTLGHYSKAIEHFNNTLRLKPDYMEAHLHLATCYDQLGNRELADNHRTLYENRGQE